MNKNTFKKMMFTFYSLITIPKLELQVELSGGNDMWAGYRFRQN